MSLIKCKECKNVVSNTAKVCPKCGAKVARTPIGCGSAIGIIFLLLIIMASLESVFQSESPTTVNQSHLECDSVAAIRIQSMLREMATWKEKNDVITFKWGPDWDETAPHDRIELVKTFSNSDACLTGRAREINFYRIGRLVAEASPTSGIRLVD
ncbi:MAG: hypothetical protein NMNS01_24780 [Nitrosomonas sp.]|nr:MAG: hypothetical protein NMNS01_24780 [Nitrosomonas sp.]